MTTHVENEASEDGDLICQTMLGDAMQTLHDFPIVSDQIEVTRASAGTLGDPILHASLLGEFERVKIALQPGALEETTKLWSALSSANFRRGVMYRVSVVQIESRTPRRSAQPVQTRHFFVTTRRRPEISEVYRSPVTASDVVGDVRVRVGEEITVIGRNLLGLRCWVRLGELEPIRIQPDSDRRTHVTLPDADYPVDPDHAATRPIPADRQIQPGALKVQVIVEHDVESVHGALDRGVTTQVPRTFRSNIGVVLVVPQITSAAPASGTAAALFTVNGTRLYRSDLVSYVMLGDAAIEVRPPAASDPWVAPTATSIQVPLASLPEQLPPPPPGGRDLLVRVQVNDAQNRESTFSFRWMP
jgi:hypothetical protein